MRALHAAQARTCHSPARTLRDTPDHPYKELYWDLGPLFAHAGTLNTHLQNHYASQALSKALGKGRRG